ncbi:hypothetical protein Taro_012126 [Colocasia esculenta]|uniref:Uncharacterized protein n=1 Tax=Colocasia esculenta TaxID=4460 RepID=A0A843UC25_COLES|nr:hypothetical protein [Colocasia esculenta]
MGWECSSLVNPTMAAFLLHGLTRSSRCPSSGLSYTSRVLRPDGMPRRRVTVGARLDDSPDGSQQQLNFSVLRFTLGDIWLGVLAGIPGLDESYLPRYLGLAFGSLIVLNHFLGSSDFPTPAQLRSEALGICLAGFSAALPYFGNFLKGASPVDRSFLPEGNTQLISVGDALCIRGYWDLAEDSSKALVLDSFRRQIQQTGLIDLNDAIYFPQGVDAQFFGMLPKGTLSVLLQPVYGAYDPSGEGVGPVRGFILLASSSSYAYRDSDRAWISAVAKKFQGINPCTD